MLCLRVPHPLCFPSFRAVRRRKKRNTTTSGATHVFPGYRRDTLLSASCTVQSSQESDPGQKGGRRHHVDRKVPKKIQMREPVGGARAAPIGLLARIAREAKPGGGSGSPTQQLSPVFLRQRGQSILLFRDMTSSGALCSCPSHTLSTIAFFYFFFCLFFFSFA